MDSEDIKTLQTVQARSSEVLQQSEFSALPKPESIAAATAAILQALPATSYGLSRTTSHILNDLSPGLNNSSLSPNYYGFVTGGVTPAARLADNWTTLFDQNVQVHLPEQTVATAIEDRVLSMLLELLKLDPRTWPARTTTTGATGSNVVGLACGREYVLSKALQRAEMDVPSGSEGLGLLEMCRRANVSHIQVLTTMGHSSLFKAASIVGIGTASVVDVGTNGSPLKFDPVHLEKQLSLPKSASIVVVSCGEVNTGAFATESVAEVQAIRGLCDRYDVWLHVDGGEHFPILVATSMFLNEMSAFGLFARALPTSPQYSELRAGAIGLDMADSLCIDGYKLLNVPYDCGFFFSKHEGIPQRVFQNPNASYLSSSGTDAIASPLNIGMENSRRFRALPVYATLVAYGREGYAAMLGNMVNLARKVASFIYQHPAFRLLPERDQDDDYISSIFMVVLFQATDDILNQELVARINSTRKIYVSGTTWHGRPAARMAIAKWDVDVERDSHRIYDVLNEVAACSDS